MRQLNRPLRHPYYILAPDYNRSSAGVRVMHMLCDALNQSGQEAYMVVDVVDPALRTPQLQDEDRERHRRLGLEPIAVYPEVVSGNPLAAAVVARYLLNRPGLLTGDHLYHPDDLMFAYSKDLLQPGMPEERVMFLPSVDLDLFRPAPDDALREPGRVAFYRGRAARAEIDPALIPPGSIEITRQYPETRRELVEIFQRCEIFYSYESSALLAEAALCGCLAVCLPNESAPALIAADELERCGIAFGTDADEVRRARETLPRLRERFEALEALFWERLDTFIRITQAAAAAKRPAAVVEIVPTAMDASEPVAIGETTGLTGDPVKAVDRFAEAANRYQYWCFDRTLLTHDLEAMRAAWSGLWTESRPFAHLFVQLLPERHAFLRSTLDTLQSQIVDDWHLTVVALEPCPEEFAAEPRLDWHELGDDEDSLDYINHRVLASPAAWIGQIEGGDRLGRDALFKIGVLADAHPDYQVVYTDEDRLGENQRRKAALFKPDIDPDYLRSMNYIGGLALCRREAFLAAGAYRAETDGVEDYDLWLRLLDVCSAAAFGHVPEVLYFRFELGGHACEPPMELWESARRSLQAHLDRRSPGAVAELNPALPPSFRVIYPLSARPRVSVIIATRDHYLDLSRCIRSLSQKTSYRDFELIVVDNDSKDPQTLAYLDELEKTGQARVLRYPGAFNFSAINNLAAREASGELLLLLNNDVWIEREDWLDWLVRQALRPEVGAVGPKLLFPDGTVQHAGVVLGLNHQAADHVFLGAKGDDAGYMGRIGLPHGVSAVTGACLLVKKSLFDACGGLDEASLAVSLQDVDLCLRLRERGFLVVYEPRAVLTHKSSTTQKSQLHFVGAGKVKAQQDREFDTFVERWKPLIGRDPYYNPNLSLADRSSAIEFEPVITVPATWRPGPRVIAFPNDHWGCGEYRIKAPIQAVVKRRLAQGGWTERILGASEMLRFRPDVIVAQRQLQDNQIEALARYRKACGAPIVFELDDLLEVSPRDDIPQSQLDELFARLKKALAHCDRLVASTPQIAEAYAGLVPETRVIPNFIDLDRWGALHPRRRGGDKPRVGWAGGSSHVEDLEVIAEVVRILKDEVEWVFFGLIPEAIRPFVHEFRPAKPIAAYPAALAALDLDLAIAPLRVSRFNQAKSHLRLLEYGVLGFPVVCTDIEPYRGEFPVTRVRNTVDDWVGAIRELIADRGRLAEQGDRLQRHVFDHWTLEANAEAWLKGWLGN